MTGAPPPPQVWVVDFLIAVVCVVWAFTIIADAFIPAYEPPPVAGRALMFVASALLIGRGVSFRPDRGSQ